MKEWAYETSKGTAAYCLCEHVLWQRLLVHQQVQQPTRNGSVMRINTLTTRCVMVGVMQNRGLLWSTTSLILMPISSQSTLQDQFLPKGNVVCVHKEHCDMNQGITSMYTDISKVFVLEKAWRKDLSKPWYINTTEVGEGGVSILGYIQKLSGHGAGHRI